MAKAIPMGSTIAEALETADLKAIAAREPQDRRPAVPGAVPGGDARNASTHAAGVVISRDPLDEHVPLQRATKGEEGIITQWAFQMVEKIGLLKMDFLGLANLTILDAARQDHRPAPPGAAARPAAPADRLRRPLGDAQQDLRHAGPGRDDGRLPAGDRRACGAACGLLRPTQVQHLLAIVALYRPGPMDSIPGLRGGEERPGRRSSYLHPDLEEILEETYGICVYQDQVLQIVRKIAGFTWGEADVLRKAMGKKIACLMAEQREKFLARTVERGYDAGLRRRSCGPRSSRSPATASPRGTPPPTPSSPTRRPS